MDVTAPSAEQSRQLSEVAKSPLASETPVAADPAVATDSVAAPQKKHKSSSSASLRFAAAWVFMGIALIAVGFSTTNPGVQPLRLSALLILGSCIVATLIELFRVVQSERTSGSKRSIGELGFEALSFGAVALIGAGSAIALFGSEGAPSLLISIAPAIASATLFLSRGVVARASRISREPEQSEASSHKEIAKGASLALKTDSIVPVDAQVVRGSCAVDECIFSPVPTFRIREEGDVVYAGSKIIAGSAEVMALSTTQNSCMQQLRDAVKPMVDAASNGLRLEDQRAAKGTVLAILFIAIAAAISWNERSSGYVDSLMAAGTVALIASLCHVTEFLYALRSSLVSRWFTRGLLLASAESPKQLAGISKVVFDPSRIARGSRYAVADLEVLDDRLSRSALCDCVASLLGRAEDPLLVAAGEYCRHVATKLSVERVLELREYSGRGICGSIHGIELSVGDEDFLVERGIMVQPTDSGSADESGHPVVLVAIDDDVVARFHMSTDQEGLITEEELSAWPARMELSVSSGVATQLGSDTLLVRGHESDLVGQMATYDVTLVSPKEPEIRKATILAFTPDLSALKDLLRECKQQGKLVERTRIIIGFAGFVVVAGVFAGVLTPLFPLGLLLILAASIRLA